MEIVELSRDEVLAALDDFERLYARAFGAPGYDEPPEAAQRFRAEQLPRHAGREGFRCVVARRDERMIGFAYGYTGERGQFWSDWVAGLPHARALLSTYRDDRPAPRLYRGRGWELLFEGLAEDSDLYGLRLDRVR